jgi:hypothetical protein
MKGGVIVVVLQPNLRSRIYSKFHYPRAGCSNYSAVTHVGHVAQQDAIIAL